MKRAPRARNRVRSERSSRSAAVHSGTQIAVPDPTAPTTGAWPGPVPDPDHIGTGRVGRDVEERRRGAGRRIRLCRRPAERLPCPSTNARDNDDVGVWVGPRQAALAMAVAVVPDDTVLAEARRRPRPPYASDSRYRRMAPSHGAATMQDDRRRRRRALSQTPSTDPRLSLSGTMSPGVHDSCRGIAWSVWVQRVPSDWWGRGLRATVSAIGRWRTPRPSPARRRRRRRWACRGRP